MIHQSKRNIFKKAGEWALKLSIAAASFWFIYKEVISRENFKNIADQFSEMFQSPGRRLTLIFIFLLMFMNWSVEALKWKLMMKKIESIPFFRSLEAVFSGLTISFFTPNRIGEYAGRVFHLRTANKIEATLITILENLSQLIITLVVGAASLVFYIHQYTSLHFYLFTVIVVLAVIFIAGVLILFFEVPFLDAAFIRLRMIKRFAKYLEVLSSYSKRELLKLLVLAFIRCFIFTFQYFLLLKVFGIEVSYSSAILLINMIFLVITIIPTFALTELGVRGAVATYFLSKISYDSLAILNASVSLWFINLVIPSLIGIIFIFQFRFYNTSTTQSRQAAKEKSLLNN